ncbi:hypothetical protein MM787_002559 [Enterococcus faecium]|nr:hypothetical protein [Enterococcus faecium]
MYKILLIEDQPTDIESCSGTLERMNYGENKYELITAPNFEEGKKKLKEDIDCAIIDIKLDEENTGNDLLDIIQKDLRIPVAVMTGTPDTNLPEGSPIKIYKKGNTNYQEIIENLYEESSTGLFNVIGGKGIIEETMNKVFWQNLYPNINIWKDMKNREENINTEQILLRYAIGHIQEILDSESVYQVEEMYICPPINENLQTGSVLMRKNDSSFHVVLSPPCDLVVRANGETKTNHILLVEIENAKILIPKIIQKTGATNKKSKKSLIKKIVTNNYNEYSHWLPKNPKFDGGIINFRMVSTTSLEELNKSYEKPIVKIQDHFTKSILSRFSSYYARQGQPDFSFDYITENLLEEFE